MSSGNPPFDWSFTTNPLGLTLNEYTGLITGTIPADQAIGTYTTTVRVTDDDGDTDIEGFIITVTSLEEVTFPLEMLFIPNFYRNQGSGINFQARATGGSSPYTWTLPLNPLNLSIGRTSGIVTRTIPSNQATGPYVTRIRVVDFDDVIAERTFTVTIGSQTQDTRPVIGPIDDFDQRQGTSITPIQATVFGGNAPFTWAFRYFHNPLGLSISSTGRITGSISSQRTTGPYLTWIQVRDADGDIDYEDFLIDVTSEDTEENMIPLIIGAIGNFSVRQGSDVRFQARAAGGTRPYEWSFVLQFNPLGLSIDPITGDITKTPVPANQGTGPYSTRIQVEGADGDTDIENFVVTVVRQDEDTDDPDDPIIPGLTLPRISSIEDFAVEQPDTVDLRLHVSGGDSPYIWTFFLEPLDLTINESTGRITGRISYYQPWGAYYMGVQVEDNNGNTDTETFWIRVSPVFIHTPLIGAIPDFDVRQGGQVRLDTRLTGGLAPFTWTIPTNPLGLSISSTGRITGSISSQRTPGNYSTTIRVEDTAFTGGVFFDSPETDEETFVVRVVGGDTIPLITAISDFSLAQGGQINFIARVAGGNAPLTWSLPTNPLNLSIDSSGRITRTLSAQQTTGSYSTTVQVEDTDGDTDTEIFVVRVTENRPRIDYLYANRFVRGDIVYVRPVVRGGTPPYTWSFVSNPLNLFFNNPPTGDFTGNLPTALESIGFYVMTIAVTDANGYTDTEIYGIEIYHEREIF